MSDACQKTNQERSQPEEKTRAYCCFNVDRAEERQNKTMKYVVRDSSGDPNGYIRYPRGPSLNCVHSDLFLRDTGSAAGLNDPVSLPWVPATVQATAASYPCPVAHCSVSTSGTAVRPTSPRTFVPRFALVPLGLLLRASLRGVGYKYSLTYFLFLKGRTFDLPFRILG